MTKYKYLPTNYITEAFKENGIHFHVISIIDKEEIHASFPIENGPFATVRFIVTGNENDVGVRVFGLINGVDEEKHSRVLQVNNQLNYKIRYLKFVLDPTDNSINVESDIPQNVSDDCLGEVALEMFVRTMRVLQINYKYFPQAVYTNDDLIFEDEDTMDALPVELQKKLLQRVQAIREKLDAEEADILAELEDDLQVETDDSQAETDDLSRELDDMIEELEAQLIKEANEEKDAEEFAQLLAQTEEIFEANDFLHKEDNEENPDNDDIDDDD